MTKIGGLYQYFSTQEMMKKKKEASEKDDFDDEAMKDTGQVVSTEFMVSETTLQPTPLVIDFCRIISFHFSQSL